MQVAVMLRRCERLSCWAKSGGIAIAGVALFFTFWRPVSPARAQVVQPVRCSAFLHNHDGSWSSFVDATFLAVRGPVPVHPGERLSRRGSPAQADLAHLLDRICEVE